MTLIESEVLTRWTNRTVKSNLDRLENLIEFKPYYEEVKYRGAELEQIYKEGAKANGMAVSSFKERVLQVMRFSDCDLRRWFAYGISFDHLKHAGSLYPDAPAELLEQCIDPGDENGDTLTVDKMINLVLEGRQDRAKSYKLNVMLSNFSRKFLHAFKIEGEKAKMFEARLRDLISEFVEA